MISHSFISFSAVQKIWATHCILTCNNVLFVQEKYQPTVKPDSSLSGCNVITPGEVAYILQAYWYYFFIDCFTLCSIRGEAREVVIKFSKPCCTIQPLSFLIIIVVWGFWHAFASSEFAVDFEECIQRLLTASSDLTQLSKVCTINTGR